ncbi:hypothetical protein PPSQR21_038450 [Paenibacillus polymyxa SQR-21]|uniref:hypothetical protein n=1 Tax=Paenibacillus polymyxa TaxID=1406 RepID=UPI00042F0318|nr:hypothetical protein [Paenibacillus polymyxa]AHM67483.1 hypothetical protein PPSQR21_038450 [Paenibacillus polymyxa SQR-21]
MKKDKVLVFNDDDKTCELVSVKDVSAEAVATENGMYHLEDLDQRIDIRNGNVIYLAKVDMPAKIEAEKLIMLRRSVALKRMLNFNVKDGIDWGKLFPYIIIIALIIFK